MKVINQIQRVPYRPSIPRTPLQLAKMFIMRAGENPDPMRVASLAFDLGRESASNAQKPAEDNPPKKYKPDKCPDCGGDMSAWETVLVNPGLDSEHAHASLLDRACEMCDHREEWDTRENDG